jgi:hypothetical protein
MGPILNNYGAMRVCVSLKRTPVNGASHQTFTPYATLNMLRFFHAEACDVSISKAFLWHSKRAIHNRAMKFLAAEAEIFEYLLYHKSV